MTRRPGANTGATVRRTLRLRAAGVPARERGGTLVGFLAGLIVGLGIAVVVALFVTRAPVPFVNKGNRAPEPSLSREGPLLPDPNLPLNSRGSTPAPGEPASPTAAAPAAPLPPTAAIAPQSPSAVDSAPPDARQQGGYILQAGAFRSSDDAEGMKARLALLGYEARVQPAEVNGQTMYRVRIGPFAQQDDANRARGRLTDGGIESSVIRQR